MSNGINQLIAQGRPAPTWDYQESMKNTLAIQRAKQDIQAFPEQQNRLRQLTQRGTEEFEMKKTDWLQEQEMKPLKDDITALDYLMRIGPMLNYGNYAKSREHLIRVNKINPSLLPPPESFKDPQSFEAWKGQALMTASERLERLKQQEPGPKGKEWKDYQGAKEELNKGEDKIRKILKDIGIADDQIEKTIQEIMEPRKKDLRGIFELDKEKDKAKSQLGTLIDENKDLDPHDPNKTIYGMAIQKEAVARGWKITMDKDGNFEMVEGPLGAEGGLTPAMKTDIQKKIINSTDARARLANIKAEFKPEYQTYETKFSTAWSSIKEKAGMDLSFSEKKKLGEYSEYKRKAVANMNRYLNDLSGAAITEQEAKRLTKALPNAGVGLFDGDSPTEFRSKLNGVIEEVNEALDRYDEIQTKGTKKKPTDLRKKYNY